jgi:hypothetical protein
MMNSSPKKRPHSLRLTFILLLIAALCYPFTKNPFLVAPAVAFVATVSLLFFIARGVLRAARFLR